MHFPATDLQLLDDVQAEQSAVAGALRELAEAFRAGVPMDPADVAARIERVVAEMRRLGMTAEGLPLNHIFAGQMYAREMLIPKGTFVIGEIHKTDHLSTVSLGELSVLNDTGGFTRIRAPFTMASPRGKRKCVYAHEDTVFCAVHDASGLGLADPSRAPLAALEALLIAHTPEEYRLHLQALQQIEVSP